MHQLTGQQYRGSNMTKTKVVVCECSGNGETLQGLQSSEYARDLNIESTSGLCRHGMGRLVESGDQELVVGCTQDLAVFDSLSSKRVFPIQFVNLRDVQRAQPGSEQLEATLVARAAYVQNYSADGVPGVVFQSSGRLVILADEHFNSAVIEGAATGLMIDVLVRDASSISLAEGRKVNVMAAQALNVSGYLGAFEIQAQRTNPVDMELCTRCGACVDACPSQSISSSNFSINLDSCDQSNACIKACGSFNAINFQGMQSSELREYDMVIDMRAKPAFSDRQFPLGYWHTGASTEGLSVALLAALQTVGEFEKPRFFQYKASTCAHRRSNIQGCSACIDTCSTKAISSQGNGVQVDPHLCLGCGACASVCPTGSIQYAFSPAQAMLRATKASMEAFRTAGGQRAHLLIHGDGLSGQWMETAFHDVSHKEALIPVPVHHSASLGPDFWLNALAYGACRVSVVMNSLESGFYKEALQGQADWVNTFLDAVGLKARVQILSVDELIQLPDSTLERPTAQPAVFGPSVDKRTRLDLALRHLAKGWREEKPIALPATAPFGTVAVDTKKCTLCLSCTGACPASALIDNPEMPQLRFVESNCVQCGLCQDTCPEGAISLTPQLNLSSSAKEKKVLNESQPFHCTCCGKAFGTKHMIENMLDKLSGHSMFAQSSKRLTMCADCRVKDMFEDKNEMTIFEVKR